MPHIHCEYIDNGVKVAGSPGEDSETDSEGNTVYLVHSGMLHAAMRVRRRLEESGLLESAFRKYPTYNLVITGHSLGAGVTALLGWSYASTAYKNSSTNNAANSSPLNQALQRLVCFSFAPPSGLVSRTASNHLRRFLCSVFLGDDLVPRLSVAAMNMLKNELLVVLRDSNVPKYRVIASGCWQLCCKNAASRALEVQLIDGASRHDYDTMRVSSEPTSVTDGSPVSMQPSNSGSVAEDPLLSSSGGYLLRAARQLSAERQHLRAAQFPHMFAPGIIVQISAEFVTDSLGKHRLEYRLSVRDCDDLQRVIVSSSMIPHHLPDPLLTALRKLSKIVEHAERVNSDCSRV